MTVLLGKPKLAEPIVIKADDGTKIAFAQTATALIGPTALSQIVENVTIQVTKNVIANVCARLKDRCSFVGGRRGVKCNVERTVHNAISHDFTEAPAPPPAPSTMCPDCKTLSQEYAEQKVCPTCESAAASA